jgi:hypothetical protein
MQNLDECIAEQQAPRFRIFVRNNTVRLISCAGRAPRSTYCRQTRIFESDGCGRPNTRILPRCQVLAIRPKSGPPPRVASRYGPNATIGVSCSAILNSLGTRTIGLRPPGGVPHFVAMPFQPQVACTSPGSASLRLEPLTADATPRLVVRAATPRLQKSRIVDARRRGALSDPDRGRWDRRYAGEFYSRSRRRGR